MLEDTYAKGKYDASKAVDVELSQEEIQYLEKLYKPHPLVGVMANNN